MANFTPAGVDMMVRGLGKFNSDLGSANRAIQNTASEASNSQGAFSRLGSGLTTVAGIAAGALVAGIGAATAATVGLGTAGIRAAIDYESAFAGVLKTTDGLTDSTGNLNQAGQELRSGFIDLSRTIPVTPEALAGIGELGGQLGIQRANLLGFTRTVADLGVTTNLSTDEAATAFAQLSNIMGTSQDMFSNLGSTTVALGNNFATTERDIVAFASRIAGAGQISGLTEADVLSIGAAMSSVGVSAEAGGTAVQKVLLGINTEVVTSGENLGKFAAAAGLSASEFATLWEQDASQAFQLFVEGLGMQGDDAILTLQELGLTDQRLTRSFLSLAGAGGLLGEAIELGNTAFAENTALATEAEQRYGTTASKIEILKNNFHANAIAIGDALLPAVNVLIDKILELTGGGSALLPVFEQVGSFLATNLPPAVDTVLAAFQATSEFVSTNLIPVFERVGEYLSVLLPAGGAAAGSVFTGVLIPALQAAGDFVTGVIIPGYLGLIDIIQANVVPALNTFSTWFTTNLPTIQAVFLTAFEVIRAVVASVIASITETVLPNLQAAFANITAALNALGLNWSDVWGALGQAVGLVAAAIGAAVLAIIGIVVGLVEGVSAAVLNITEAWQRLSANFTAVLDGIANLIINAVTFWRQVFTGDFPAALDTAGEAFQNFLGLTKTMLDSFVAFFDLTFGTVFELVSGFVSGVIDFFKNLANELVGNSIIPDMANAIIDVFFELGNTVLEIIGEMASNAVSVVSDFASDMISAGQDLMEGLANGIKSGASSVVSAIKDSVKNAVDSAKDALGISSPSRVFTGIGRDIGEGLILGIQQTTKKFTSEIGKMLRVAGEVASAVGGSFGDRLLEPLQNIVSNTRSVLDERKQALADALGLEGIADQELSRLVTRRFLRPDSFTAEQVRLIDRANELVTQHGQATTRLREEQEKLAKVEKQRSDLAFLEQQLDLIKLVKEQGLDSSILQGFQFGLDANLSDLLSAVSSATQAMIDQAASDLGIASPSKVFAEFGMQIMEGMTRGIMRGGAGPARAVTGATTQMVKQPALASTINNRTQNNNFDMAINNGMDANMLVALIKQTIAEAV